MYLKIYNSQMNSDCYIVDKDTGHKEKYDYLWHDGEIHSGCTPDFDIDDYDYNYGWYFTEREAEETLAEFLIKEHYS